MIILELDFGLNYTANNEITMQPNQNVESFSRVKPDPSHNRLARIFKTHSFEHARHMIVFLPSSTIIY
jgi:hypothetical protein